MGPATIAASSSAQAGLNVQAALAANVPAILILTGTSEVVVPHPENSAIAYILPLRPNEGNEQIPFYIVASGYIKTTNSSTITLKLYSGTSLTPGSNTLLSSSGAITQNTATAPWKMIAEMVYDSVSGKLTGTVEWVVNNNLVAKAAISNVITGIADTANPVANFVLSATSSAAAGANPATIQVKAFTAG